MSTTEKPAYTNAVERTIDILEFIATSAQGVSVYDIHHTFQINRTSIYSILKDLVRKEYVYKASDGRYHLTGRMFEFGQRFKNSFPIVHVTQALSRSFRPTYDCSLNTAMYFSGVSATLMNSIVFSPSSLFHADRIMKSGQTIPLHATSMGKLLLAYLPPASSKHLLEQMTFEPYTDKTISSIEGMWEQMHQIVDQGYAIELGEYYSSCFCVAAPVFDHTNTVVAACSLSCDITQLKELRDTAIRDVSDLAKTISSTLGASVH